MGLKKISRDVKCERSSVPYVATDVTAVEAAVICKADETFSGMAGGGKEGSNTTFRISGAYRFPKKTHQFQFAHSNWTNHLFRTEAERCGPAYTTRASKCV